MPNQQPNIEQQFNQPAQPVDNQPGKPQTNLKYILIVLILATLVGGGILAYQYWWLPKQETKMPEVTKDETANWQTYRNEEYGFEVKYPQDWEMKERDELFGKEFSLNRIGVDSLYVQNVSVIIILPEGNPTSLPVVNIEEREIYFAGRKATAWLFLTEEGDVWRRDIVDISDVPKNWSEYSYIMIAPARATRTECAAQLSTGEECSFEMGVRIFGTVDKKESELLNQIISTFKFIR